MKAVVVLGAVMLLLAVTAPLVFALYVRYVEVVFERILL
jgi:hypothetical protein